MNKYRKGIPNKKSSRTQERGGGLKRLPCDGGKGTASQHKTDDLNSIQNNKGVHQEQEVGASSSGSQVGTSIKCSGERECKELTANGSIGTGFEMSDIFYCAECRVILKEMVETHPQKDVYISKFEEHHVAHAVGSNQMSEGPSGEQKGDIQSSDVKSSTGNQPAGPTAEQFSRYDTGEEGRDNEENEMDASAAEERSSVGEDCQAAWGGGHWGEGPVEGCDAWWDRQQPENKRSNEGSHSRERNDNQKVRRDEENWRTEDRGGAGRTMKYEDKGCKIVKEVYADLFTAPKESSLAHCVATDMRMGSGIAVSFRQNFKNVGELLDQGARVGDIAVLEHEGRYIYYLVTKKYSNGKPYFDDLVSSLKKMRDHCAEHGVKHLALPRIGCGLDRLEWRDVKPKIEEIFSGLDISITVYNFNQPEKEEEEERQYSRKKRHLPVKDRAHRLVTIESQTALLFFGSEDGSVDECGKDLDRKFNFLLEYRKQRRTVGGVIRLETKGEVLYGLIVRKKETDVFSYINFEKCLHALHKLVRKDAFFYIGVEAFCVNNDDVTMEKVISLMKTVLTGPELELYICWPKELEHLRRDNVEMRP